MGSPEANPTKRNKYQNFVGQNIKEVKIQNPDIQGGELMKIVSANWRKLDQAEKEKYAEGSYTGEHGKDKSSKSP